jgi:hypothetical protein
VSITSDVLQALKSAILLESRTTALAENVGQMARDMRDMDKRLVRVETLLDLGLRTRLRRLPETDKDS